VDAGLGFGDGAVVELDLGGFALDEDADGGFAAGGDFDALSYGASVVADAGADGDREIGGGIAGVGDIDGDQVVAGRGGGGEDAVDGEVRQSLVGIDPICEKPGEVGVGVGGFEEFFEGTGRPGRDAFGGSSRPGGDAFGGSGGI